MFIRGIVTALILTLCVSVSKADITIEWVEVDNSSVLSGYRTFDLFANTDLGWCCNAMLFPLDTGNFYQHPLGNESVPLPFMVDLFPEIEFDTYLGAGGGPVRTTLQAGDVGGDAYQFDEVELDVSWAAQVIPVPLPSGRLHMARLTFSDDATGSWRLAISASEPDGLVEFSGTIADIIPEPASLALMASGAAVLLRRQRSDRHA